MYNKIFTIKGKNRNIILNKINYTFSNVFVPLTTEQLMVVTWHIQVGYVSLWNTDI